MSERLVLILLGWKTIARKIYEISFPNTDFQMSSAMERDRKRKRERGKRAKKKKREKMKRIENSWGAAGFWHRDGWRLPRGECCASYVYTCAHSWRVCIVSKPSLVESRIEIVSQKKKMFTGGGTTNDFEKFFNFPWRYE